MKKNLNFHNSVVIFLILVLSACGPGKIAESKLERVSNPAVVFSDVEQLVDGNIDFAFDLYHAVGSKNGNVVYSPFSISLAFAMVYGGARGETANLIANVLHFNDSENRFHSSMNALDLELTHRSDQASGVNEKDRFQLNIANALWGQEGWSFLPEYLDLLAVNYGAGMRLVDFMGAPENARNQINNWISDQTQKRIQNIIPAGMIDSFTRLVLANAIYFKATWINQFEANKTREKPFYLQNGETINVQMMAISQEKNLSYAMGDGWQAVTLPYEGNLIEMVVIVPDSGNFAAFESTLTAESYKGILSAMKTQNVILSMPKFRFETQFGLEDVLIKMGLIDAFDPQDADFSGIDGQHDLFISDVVHKAFIAVDEKGTEAAAAMVVIMGLTSLIPSGIQLTIDRPFFYFIRDIPTGTILFMGCVLDPR